MVGISICKYSHNGLIVKENPYKTVRTFANFLEFLIVWFFFLFLNSKLFNFTLIFVFKALER